MEKVKATVIIVVLALLFSIYSAFIVAESNKLPTDIERVLHKLQGEQHVISK